MTTSYAPPTDLNTYGAYGPGRLNFPGPRYPFQGRIGSAEFKAEPGRYHSYVAWVCPWAQRSAIVRTLKGLDDVVSLSYVDDERDARGWAFRERRGADPVNGFTFLQQAYDATAPGYQGHLSVPVLWDRVTGTIVSNNFPDITIDLATRFDPWGDPDVQLYPENLRDEIDDLNPYNPLGGISERRLTDFSNLWAYARDLYQRPAFRDTTDFSTFLPDRPPFLSGGPERIQVERVAADWAGSHDRERLAV